VLRSYRLACTVRGMGAVATHARQKRYQKTPRGKYTRHKVNARLRGVVFLLTFDEWWHLWAKSGHWEQRGNKLDCYVMMRIGDTGAYKVGNVFIDKFRRNFSDAHFTPKKKHTAKSTTVTW
jgi:hypothetical protein